MYDWLGLRATWFLGVSAASCDIDPLTRRPIWFPSYPATQYTCRIALRFQVSNQLSPIARSSAWHTSPTIISESLISTRPLPYAPSTLHVPSRSCHITELTIAACWSLNPESIICCHCQVQDTTCLDSHAQLSLLFPLSLVSISISPPPQSNNLILILGPHQSWQLQVVHLLWVGWFMWLSIDNPWLTLLYQMEIRMRHMFKCLGNTIYAHTFASLSLEGLMQARQLSLRRFVVWQRG